MSKKELASWLTATLMLVTVMVCLAPSVMASPAPYLVTVKDYNYSPLLVIDKWGKFNVIVTISKLWHDDVSNYDWYFYHLKLQSVPGYVAYGTDVRTDKFWSWHKTWPYGTTDRWLVDYGPTTTSGVSYVSYTLTAGSGPEGPSASFSQTRGYSVPDVRVYDLGDFSEGRAEWKHDLKDDKAVAKYTYLAKPSFVIKTRQNSVSFLDGQYSCTWTDPPAWWKWRTWWVDKKATSSILYLDAYKYGDH